MHDVVIRGGTIVDDIVSPGATASDYEVDQIVSCLAANCDSPKEKEDSKP